MNTGRGTYWGSNLKSNGVFCAPVHDLPYTGHTLFCLDMLLPKNYFDVNILLFINPRKLFFLNTYCKVASINVCL